jgi:chromosome segregation ATPase
MTIQTATRQLVAKVTNDTIGECEARIAGYESEMSSLLDKLAEARRNFPSGFHVSESYRLEAKTEISSLNEQVARTRKKLEQAYRDRASATKSAKSARAAESASDAEQRFAGLDLPGLVAAMATLEAELKTKHGEAEETRRLYNASGGIGGASDRATLTGRLDGILAEIHRLGEDKTHLSGYLEAARRAVALERAASTPNTGPTAADLEARAGELAGQIATLEGQRGQAESIVAGLSDRVGQYGDGLGDVVGAIEADAERRNQLASARGLVSALDGQIATLQNERELVRGEVKRLAATARGNEAAELLPGIVATVQTLAGQIEHLEKVRANASLAGMPGPILAAAIRQQMQVWRMQRPDLLA